MPEQQRQSVAVVSGGTVTLATIAGYLDLPLLDELSRLVEAYILHDESFYFNDGGAGGAVADVIKNLDEGLLISSRYTFRADKGEKLSPLLRPFVHERALAARDDLERAGRLLRGYRPDSSLIPSRERTRTQWLHLAKEAEEGFVRAELRLSEELKATYYTTPDGSQVTNACIRQFASSTVAMVRHFNTMRTAELKKLQIMLKPQSIEVSPPLILAYAVACSENLKGFISSLKDLRTDNRLSLGRSSQS